MAYDPEVYRAFLETIGVIKLSQEVFSRPGFSDKIMAIAQSAPPLLAPGPSREELLQLSGVKRGEGAHMSVVLVHGNPETIAVWDPLRAALDRDDIVCLSPPGFGAPVPDGWGATVEDYRDWLISELEAMESPVDLVGHDWGGGHVVAVAMKRPDLLRSWSTDVIGIFDAEYVWHDLAQLWQTPGAGEEAVEAWASESVDERAARLQTFGITPDVATKLAQGYDKTMASCILTLYRSAAQPKMAQLGEGLAAATQRPGLHLSATDDPFVGAIELQRRAAERAGARIEILDGLGHWWMVQDPQRGATALRRFWSSLDNA